MSLPQDFTGILPPDIAIPSPDAHYVLEISKNLENETEELLALSGHTGAA